MTDAPLAQNRRNGGSDSPDTPPGNLASQDVKAHASPASSRITSHWYKDIPVLEYSYSIHSFRQQEPGWLPQ